MTSENDPFRNNQRKPFGTKRLVRDVTSANYQELGNSFGQDNGFAMIALADGKDRSVEWTASPPQWGAWHAYFRHRKIPTQFMTRHGQAGKCWTVPAEWPHLFDSDATVQGDQQAADFFMRGYRPPRQDLKRELDAELRRAAVNRLRRGSQANLAAAE
jgi:hypothetical protein